MVKNVIVTLDKLERLGYGQPPSAFHVDTDLIRKLLYIPQPSWLPSSLERGDHNFGEPCVMCHALQWLFLCQCQPISDLRWAEKKTNKVSKSIESTVRTWGVREESWQKFETVYLDKGRILPSCHLTDSLTCHLFYYKQLCIFEHILLQCSVTGNTVNIPTKKYKSWLLTLMNYKSYKKRKNKHTDNLMKQ